jgi:hypothetical protein
MLTFFLLNSLTFWGCAFFWKRGKSFLLTYISVMVFGVFFDFALNLVVYGTTSVSYLVPHPIYHHTLKPGYHRMRFWPDYDECMYVNSFGMRNKEVTEHKPEDLYRIVILGDSFCMGNGVRDEKVFSVILENELNHSEELKNKHQVHYQVLNFGVNTYVPILEYLQFKHVGVNFHPDLVVQFYDMSDLQQEDALRNFDRIVALADDNTQTIIAIPGKDRNEGTTIDTFLTTVDHAFQYRLFFISLLYRRIDHWLTGKRKHKVLEEYGMYLVTYTLQEDQAPFEKLWQQIFESLLLTREICREEGVVYVLTTYPWKHQSPVKGKEIGWWGKKWEVTQNISPFSKLASFSEEEGIYFINLYDEFCDYDGNKPLYFDNDIHFTEAGHKLVAEALFEKLKPIIGQTYPHEEP